MSNLKKLADAAQQPAQKALRFLKGGASIFMEHGGRREVIKGEMFSPADVPDHDSNSYFSHKLRVYHAGNGVAPQSFGAPLPAIPQKDNKPALTYKPHEKLEWTQENTTVKKLKHAGKRLNEKSIMGESANSAVARGGIAEKALTAWTHIKPDHLNVENRQDPRLRVPGYVGANQVHTMFEKAAKQLSKKFKDREPVTVTREIGEPVAGGSELPSTLKLGFGLKGKDGSVHNFVHEQPYFSNKGGRPGDDKAIAKFLLGQQKLIDSGLPTLADTITRPALKTLVQGPNGMPSAGHPADPAKLLSASVPDQAPAARPSGRERSRDRSPSR